MLFLSTYTEEIILKSKKIPIQFNLYTSPWPRKNDLLITVYSPMADISCIRTIDQSNKPCIVLDRHSELVFFYASSQKEHSAVRHANPLGHVFLTLESTSRHFIPLNTAFSVEKQRLPIFGATRSGNEPTTHRTRTSTLPWDHLYGLKTRKTHPFLFIYTNTHYYTLNMESILTHTIMNSDNSILFPNFMYYLSDYQTRSYINEPVHASTCEMPYSNGKNHWTILLISIYVLAPCRPGC